MEQSESLRVGAGQPSGGGGPCVTCLRDTPSSARDIRRGRELETSDLRAQGEAGPSGPRYFCGLGWQKNVLRFWPNSERNPRFSYVAQRKKLLYKEWKKRLATPTGFQFLDGPARAKQIVWCSGRDAPRLGMRVAIRRARPQAKAKGCDIVAGRPFSGLRMRVWQAPCRKLYGVLRTQNESGIISPCDDGLCLGRPSRRPG